MSAAATSPVCCNQPRCCSPPTSTGLIATYVQTLQMGKVGRYVLFNLRNALFTKLQQLPVDFFNQNKAGDLISRINNDTDKLNQSSSRRRSSSSPRTCS